jgi:hypothetical protein
MARTNASAFALALLLLRPPLTAQIFVVHLQDIRRHVEKDIHRRGTWSGVMLILVARVRGSCVPNGVNDRTTLAAMPVSGSSIASSLSNRLEKKRKPHIP